jgi:DNA-directed RNA polymerase specialized sigma24 family protein
MTAASSFSRLHHTLGEGPAWERLARWVHRRVPANEAEDVVQTVAEGALAAPPCEPGEIGRWLAGVARHKVADHHRRQRRRPEPLDEEPATGGASADTRVFLARVLEEGRARDGQALEWIVRAHDGEALEEIAREENLPAPTVRKRVSRLRSSLRALFLVALVLPLGAALRSREEPIGPEPVAAEGAAIRALDGDWRVVNAECTDRAPAAPCALAPLARVHVRGGLAEVDAPGSLGAARARVVRRADGSLEVIALRAAAGDHEVSVGTISLAGDRVELAGPVVRLVLARE